MGLIKQRPTIELRLPDRIVPGATFEGEVVLTTEEPLAIEGIDGRIHGEEWSQGLVGEQPRRTAVGTEAVAAARRLPAGRTVLPLRIALPPEMPPTYRGKLARASYTLTIGVMVRYWPDWSEQFDLVVSPSETPPWLKPGKACDVSTTTIHARSGTPDMGCHLDSDVVAMGNRLQGSVAVPTADRLGPREISVVLQSRERFTGHDGPQHEHINRDFATLIPLVATPEGARCTIDLQVPRQQQPSTHTSMWSFAWSLELSTRIRDQPWREPSHTLTVPVTILPPSSQEELAKVLRLTNTAYEAEVFERRWRHVAADLGMWRDEHGLACRIGGVRVSITAVRRGAEGRFLVAELHYPDLHLDLDGGLASGFHRVFNRGIALGDARWDRRHYLTGRDANQLRAFLPMMAPLLVRHEVADLDDRHLVLQRRDPELRLESIADLGRSAISLAQALTSARNLIPPPTAMQQARGSWSRLAAELGEPLETARMAVRGRFAGADVAAITHWTPRGEPLSTVVSLRTGQPIAETHRLDLAGSDVIAGNLAHLHPAARKMIEKLSQRVLAISIDEHLLSASLPAPLLDPAPIIPVLELLVSIARLLCGRGGPYRASA
jgi:hypothetical protein